MRADGTTFPVELTITRIDVPGPPTFTGYLRDITERKAAEAELRASRARIVEAADDARRSWNATFTTARSSGSWSSRSTCAWREPGWTTTRPRARAPRRRAGDLEEATRELRELARGIHPAALTEGGLRPALEALVARSSVPADWSPSRTHASPRRWRPPPTSPSPRA